VIRVTIYRWAATIMLACGLSHATSGRAADFVRPLAHEEFEERFVQFENPFGRCDGRCRLLVNVGPYLNTPFDTVFGLDGLAAPWEWETSDDAIIVAISASRPILTVFDTLEIAPEVGVAKRFGQAASEEIWGSVNFRATNFPWSHIVRTKVSIGIGANYAFRLDDFEDDINPDSDVEHLLAYLSPEIAVGLPQYPNVDLVLRIHHRSGGRDYVLGNLIGSNEAGGAQFLTVGLGWNF